MNRTGCDRPGNIDRIEQALTRSGRLQLAVADEGNQKHAERRSFHIAINDMRALMFLIMLGLSIQQLIKGHFLAPALTLLLYVADLLAGLRLEQDAAAPPARPDDRA